ncbi:extracellular solute-binding protein [Catenuloplanes japonicus]|uniref:extracellular solute-binding protein n=1 Tax=Catenuloplanes japonicus TaxID=33876 RepID=UPI0005277CFB|nr:extracellular solute-binding protein [Catenuloplanes japonicus]
MFATAAAVVLLAAGCTTGGTDTPQQDAAGPAELLFWNTGSDEQAASLQVAADRYKETHPDVTVKVQAISWDDGHAKVLTAATSKSGPDIISGGLSWGIEFGELGGMIDLNAYDIAQAKQQTRPELWNSITSTDGAVYGIPMDMVLYVFYYRPDLLEAAGVTKAPATWEELFAAVEKVKASGVVTPLVEEWGTFEWLPWFNYLKQAGGALYSDDCSQVTISSDQAVLATTTWADQYRKYGVPKATVDVGNGLAKGEYAMAIGASYLAGGFDAAHPELKGKWQTAPLPVGPAGAGSFVGGKIVGAMAHTRFPQAAADFVTWLYTDEAVEILQREVFTRGGELYISPRPELLDKANASDNLRQTLKATLNTVTGPPNCKGWETSGSEVSKRLQAVVNDGKDPKAALDEAATIMQDNLR